MLVDCDYNDYVGCGAGLICGTNNCAKFHELGKNTGMSESTDCCEKAPPRAYGGDDVNYCWHSVCGLQILFR